MKFSTNTPQNKGVLIRLLFLLILAVGLAGFTYVQMNQKDKLESEKSKFEKSLKDATAQLEPLIKERDTLRKQVEVLTQSNNEIQETAQALALQLGKKPTTQTITKK